MYVALCSLAKVDKVRVGPSLSLYKIGVPSEIFGIRCAVALDECNLVCLQRAAAPSRDAYTSPRLT